MFNQDVVQLFEEVKMGTQVKVRTLPESLAAEGPYMDDAWGFAVPNTAESEAQKNLDLENIAANEAAKAAQAAKEAEIAAKARDKADKQRLRECRRNNIDAAICPPLPEEVAPEEATVVNFRPAITAGPTADATVN